MSSNSVLMVVTARGGSKSVPRKNLARVGNRPLMWWTIKAALGSKYCSRLVVSTDDGEIARAGSQMGAEVPFLRPAELAQDDTPGSAPALHATRWLDEHQGYQPDFVMLLQPTSPFRTTEDIDAAVELALNTGADAVVSVTPTHHHPYWLKRLDESGRMSDFMALEHPAEGRQTLPKLYALNGAIYLARREVLLEDESFYKRRTYGYPMPPERSLDIDTAWDLHVADLVLRETAGCGGGAADLVSRADRPI